MKSSSSRRPGAGATARQRAGGSSARRGAADPGSGVATAVTSPASQVSPPRESGTRTARTKSRPDAARIAGAPRRAADRAVAAKPRVAGARPTPTAGARPTGREGLRQMMSGNAARRLGIELVSASPRRLVARIAVRAEHLNRGERVNGGVLMAFADLLGAAGTVLNLPAGHRTTTLESKTNFFAAGQGPVITAVSTPLHIGRSTSVWQTRIENADGRLVAIVTQTQIILPPAATPS